MVVQVGPLCFISFERLKIVCEKVIHIMQFVIGPTKNIRSADSWAVAIHFVTIKSQLVSY